MRNKHAATIKISYKLLEQLLNLPEGVRIYGIYQDPSDHLHEQVKVKVRDHPDLPVVIEGAEIPEMTPEAISNLQPHTGDDEGKEDDPDEEITF